MCRRRSDDSALVRAGRGADGAWYLGRGHGRGVWWCADDDCEQSLQASHVARALRRAVNASDMQELEAMGRAGKRSEL